MFSIQEMYEDIVVLADILEEKDIDTFKFPRGVEPEKIDEWENKNASKLPQGYKDFIVLVNGFRLCGTEVFPLERISVVEVPVEFKGNYCIGTYIGDGSLLLSDERGNFYYGDHAFGIEEAEFSAFVENHILRYMKDAFKDNAIEIPDNINTRETEEDKRKQEAKIEEMLRKLEEIKKRRGE